MPVRPAILLLTCFAWATGSAQLPDRLTRILAAHQIPVDSVSVLVREPGADSPVLSQNPLVPRNPASVIKLVTTWAALDVLGPTYTWPTEVYFLGDWDGRVLNGDLALKGYGDPWLVTEEFWKLLRDVRQTGLVEIRGDLLIDDSAFVDAAGDPGEFDGQSRRPYNVVPNALLINYQAVRFRFATRPGESGVHVTADPLPANLEIVNRLRTVSGPCRGYQAGITVDVRGGEAGNPVVLTGDFPSACAPYSLSRAVLRHDSFAFGVFSTLWAELGGVHEGGWRRGTVSEELEPALVWESPPLAEVIRSINKFSNNVMTRQLLYTLGVEASDRPGTRAGGVDAIREQLAFRGLNPDSIVIDNGAGLSRRTRISAQLLADLLELAQRPPYGAEFVASMSIGGLDGTTRGRFDETGAHGRSHVKTGSLNGVAAIAGYVHASSGTTYVVAAMINATGVHRGTGQEFLDALIEWVHDLP